MNKGKQWLEDHAQAVYDSRMECLEWFIDDNISQLYNMIEINMGIDEWYDEMSHRIEKYDNRYYILEEEDLMNFRGIL